MSEWMWFAVSILALVLTAACVAKWIDAQITIKTILSEELGNDDNQNNSANS